MPWSRLIDMELNDDDQIDLASIMANPVYPPGLRICLCGPQLEKLGLDTDCEVGDMIDLRAFATVTNVTKDKFNSRVELQIEKLAVENEMTESNDEEEGEV